MGAQGYYFLFLVTTLNASLDDKLGDYTFLQVAGSTSGVTITIPANAKELFIEAAASSDTHYMMVHGVLPISVAKKYADSTYVYNFSNFDGTTRYYFNINVQNISNNKIGVTWPSIMTSPSIFYR